VILKIIELTWASQAWERILRKGKWTSLRNYRFI